MESFKLKKDILPGSTCSNGGGQSCPCPENPEDRPMSTIASSALPVSEQVTE